MAVKNKKSSSPQRPTYRNLKWLWRVQLLVVVLVAVTLGLHYQFRSKAYTGHHAECSGTDASQYTVATGSTFTATVKMLNDGSTVWTQNYGVFLGDPDNTWSFQGNTIPNNVNPGQSKVFNLTLHAPAKAGTYPFRPAIMIIYSGTVPNTCPNKNIIVVAPPTISSFSASPSTITSGQSSNLSWTSSGTSCQINSSPVGSGGSGSTSVKPGSTTTYALVCSNGVGSVSRSLTVTVNPASPPNGGNNGGSSGGGSKPGGGNPSTGSKPSPDTSPPSTPTGLKAASDDASKGIILNWQASTDNVGVAGYALERSEGEQGWTQIALSIDGTTYEDDTVNFSTPYHYRLRAFDAANNYSDYATADASSSGFQVNVDPANDSTISSDDQIMSVLIPSGSLDQPAFCTISGSASEEPPLIAKSKVVAGPYDLICRNSGGTILNNFTKYLTLNVQLKKLNTKGVSGLSYYRYDNSQWVALKQKGKTGKDHVAHFDLGNSTAFVVMGKQKKTSIWVTIITILGIVAGLIVAVLFVLRLLLRRKYQKQYNDYMNKIRGG